MKAKGRKSDAAPKQPQYFWEEYKYRHDLNWQRIFKFTTAIVLISIIPYLEQDIARLLGLWILIAPVLASLLAGFVWLAIRNELGLFGRIKEAYRRRQNSLLDDDLKHPQCDRSTFELLVMIYLGCLVLLSIVNGFMVWQVWIPTVLAQPVCPCP